jgi:hypothetical protein
MNDIRRFCLIRFSESSNDSLPSASLHSPSERRSIGINIPGRLEKGGEAIQEKAVL